MNQVLTVFTNNGQTYRFEGVTEFTNTTTGFRFKYLGRNSGTINEATFNNTSTAGYSFMSVDLDLHQEFLKEVAKDFLGVSKDGK